MKITKIVYSDARGGEARILVEGFPKITFVIPLQGKTTKQDVLNELYDKINQVVQEPDKDIFDNLELSKLKDTEL